MNKTINGNIIIKIGKGWRIKLKREEKTKLTWK
jgi:hypothetical protein